MRKKLCFVVIIGCLFLCSLDLAGVSMLMGLFEPGDINMDKFAHGHLLHLLTTTTFWSNYPPVPDFEVLPVLVKWESFLLTGPIILTLYFFLAYKRKWPMVAVGLISLLVGLIPWFFGMAALVPDRDPSTIGPWIVVMIVGMLYSTLGCMAFAMLDIYKMSRKANDQPIVNCALAVSM